MVKIIRVVVKLYFLGALTFSFMNLVHAGFKGGLTGPESYSLPFFLDGLAVMGAVMRDERFSKSTNRLGLRVQIVMGSLSMLGNAFAAHNVGGVVYGVGIVSLYITAEFISGHVKSVQVDVDADKAARKAAAIAKGQRTRKANARKAAAEKRILEDMLKG